MILFIVVCVSIGAIYSITSLPRFFGPYGFKSKFPRGKTICFKDNVRVTLVGFAGESISDCKDYVIRAGDKLFNIAEFRLRVEKEQKRLPHLSWIFGYNEFGTILAFNENSRASLFRPDPNAVMDRRFIPVIVKEKTLLEWIKGLP
jgi:hypothetical protein